MVRETRHLWVSNQPEIVREDRIRDHFKRSTEDVSPQSFEQRGGSYYDRNARLVSETDQYIRRSNNIHPSEIRGSNNFHPGDLRGRARERVYRNGPCSYPTITERSISGGHHRVSTWYDTGSGSISSISGQGSSPATRSVYGSVASAVVQPDTSTLYDCPLLKSKNKKSRSGSESPCGGSSSVNATSSHSSSHIVERGNGGSAASSRSHSRSPSSCSSTNSTSSNSHASSPVSGSDPPLSSTSSTTSRSRNLQSAVSAPNQSGNLVVHSEDNRPLAICVRNLPARSSDTSLKDGLFHEYKKHGKVTWVKVVGQNAERYALVCFKKPEDVEKALEVSQDKLFFGCKIEVEPYQGYDVEDNEFRPYEAELDEYHPKSTRTLFIGNLEKDITGSDIRNHFECFGEIIEIDIKKQGMNAYAFCQYSDIVSVVKAMRKMDGEHLGNNRIKLGFGKSMPTNCVWIDGIADSVSENYLTQQFKSYGPITEVVIDRERKLALVSFEQVQCAQLAVKEMRGATLRGRKLQVDFASRECREKFCSKVEKQTAGSRFSSRYGCSGSSSVTGGVTGNPDTPSTSQSRSRASSFSRHSTVNCTSAPGVGGTSPAAGASNACGTSIVGCVSNASATVNTIGPAGVTSGAIGSTSAGSSTPRGNRASRTIRHSDYDYSEQRLRSYDEFSQGSGASHDDDSYNYSSNCLRSDSPQSRLGANALDTLEVSSANSGRRRCEKSPGDIRNLQKERFQILEQLEECPSSGDELVSPKKRMKFDHSSHHHNHHHTVSSLAQTVPQSTQLSSSSTSSSAPSGLHQSSATIGTHDCNANNNTNSNNTSSSSQPVNHLIGDSNCDVYSNHSNVTSCSLHHRKCVEVRRLSECSLNLKYGSQLSSCSATATAANTPTNSRRPSIEVTGGAGSGSTSSCLFSASGGVNTSINAPLRHSGSTSSQDSTSMIYAAPHSLPCKRRRTTAGCIVGGVATTLPNSTSNDASEHHSSRGRGHQLHSHHSHEASGGESADGSRPGTPLCDERPEVSLSEPRRIPRDKPHEPMILPLPKFGLQFFQQHRQPSVGGGSSIGGQSAACGMAGSSLLHTGQLYSSSSVNSSSTNISNINSSSGLVNNTSSSSSLLNSNNNHSSLSNTLSSPPSSLVGPSRLAASSLHHHHHQHSSNNSSGSSSSSSSLSHHHHHQIQQTHHHHHPQHPTNFAHGSGPSYGPGEQPPSSPLRPRSISSNSSDSDGAAVGSSPSIEERLKTLDEMYELWSGGGSGNIPRPHLSEHPANVQQSRHKFLELDVNEVKPSEFAKRVLAKKSIFDDDLQRLKNISDKYEPGDFSNISRSSLVSTSPGIPNLAATKTPVVGGNPAAKQNSGQPMSVFHSPSVNSLQRLNSPMNSPQAMSPYNSPSPSPVVAATMAKTTNVQQCSVPVQPAKGLQYPFPSHPPVVMTPTTPPTTPVLTATQTKPKIAATTKSFSLQEKSVSQPPTTGVITSGSTVNAVNPNRVLCKSASVPGSTNVGTVKTAMSVLSPNALASTKSEDLTDSTASANSTRRSSADLSSAKTLHTKSSTTKKAEKIHKQNHRNDSDTKKSKSEKSRSESIDKRKSSLSSEEKEEIIENFEKDSTIVNERLLVDDERVKKSDTSAKETNVPASSGKKSDKEKSERKLERRREKEEKERGERERKAAADHEQREMEDKERKERELKEREEKEQKERERRESEEKERQEELARKERSEREERERKEREERERKEREERERKEREERDRREREDRERKEREERERREREREECMRREREARERREREEAAKREREEKERKEREEALRREREERERREREEAHRREREERERREREREERDRHEKEERERREKEAEERLRKDSEEQSHTERDERDRKAREKIELIEKDEHTEKRERKDREDIASDRKERKDREEKRSEARNHELHRDMNAKERTDHIDNKAEDDDNRNKGDDNSQSFRHLHHHKDDKHHHKDNNNDSHSAMIDDHQFCIGHTKRRTSASSPIRLAKRRLSSQDSIDPEESSKRIKPNTDNRKVLDRLDSKDSTRSSSKHHKSQSRANSLTKNLEEKLFVSNEERCRKDSGFEEKKIKDKEHKKYEKTSNKHKKSSSTSVEKDDHEMRSPTEKSNMFDVHEMRSSDDEHHLQQQQQRHRNKREHKEKKRHEHDEEPTRRSSDSKRHDNSRHDRKLSTKSDETNHRPSSDKMRNKPPSRKMTQSSNESDSDEPKKHSIFDILDDGPYVSMYDKVKARSCKNMQKQEEEKKIKAKFSQLKQCRAKREEKKRSTSYDGDSDSDFDDRQAKYKRSSFINSSSDEDNSAMTRIKDQPISDSDTDLRRVQYNRARLNELCDGDSSEGGSIVGTTVPCKRISSKRNSRSTRIVSDSSDTESLNRVKTESMETESHQQSVIVKHELKTEDEEETITKLNRLNAIKTEKVEPTEQSAFNLKVEIKEEPNDDIYSSHVSESEANVCSGSAVDGKDNVLDHLFTPDVRKKHKKSKKRQKPSSHALDIEGDKCADMKTEKHSPSSLEQVFDELKRESITTPSSASVSSSLPHFPEKKKHKDRKEKKREKSREDYEKVSKEERHRLRKSKKSKGSVERYLSDAPKRNDEKMEDIFGPISDEETQLSNCEATPKDTANTLLYENVSSGHNLQPVVSAALNPYKQEPLTPKSHTVEENEENKQKLSTHAERDRHRKEKREKKRKEREKNREQHALAAFQQQKQEDENSVDLDEAGRALEAQLMEDSDNKLTEETTPSTATTHKSEMHDVFRFSDGDENSIELAMQEKKEHSESHKSKEKKKKKKRSKEERHQKREHHHHVSTHANNQASSVVSNKLSIEISAPADSIDEKSEELCKPSPSLPCLLDESPPRKNSSRSDLELSISPLSREQPNMISPIPKTPTTTSSTAKTVECKKKPDKFIPGFDVELDEKISESAVQSISTEFTSPKVEAIAADEAKVETDTTIDPKGDKIEEKSRVVISQEETEDAVAALLGESFGSNTVDYSFADDPCEIQPEEDVALQDTGESCPVIPEEEAEEMRKAVQSLSTEDIEIKPDTPQSEQDLQIDTDTEEQDEETLKQDDASLKAQPPNTAALKRSCEPAVVTKPADIEKKTPMQAKIVSKTAVHSTEEKEKVGGLSNVGDDKIALKVSETEKPAEAIEKIERQSPIIGFNSATQRSNLSPSLQSGTIVPPSLTTNPKLTQPLSRPQFVMQPPTISIPDTATFVYPPINIMLSPRGNIGSDHRMPSPRHSQQSVQSKSQPASATQFVNVRVSSPQSPNVRPNQSTGIRHAAQLSPVVPPHMVIQPRQLMSPTHVPAGSQPQAASSGNMTLSRIPVTTVLAPVSSKPLQQANILLPQPTAAHTSIIGRQEVASETKDGKSMVSQTAMYQTSRMSTPNSAATVSTLNNAGHPSSAIVQIGTQPATIKSVIESPGSTPMQQVVPLQLAQAKVTPHPTVVLQTSAQAVTKQPHLQTVQTVRPAQQPVSQSQQLQHQMVKLAQQQQLYQQHQLMQHRQQQIQIQQHQHAAQILQMQHKQQQQQHQQQQQQHQQQQQQQHQQKQAPSQQPPVHTVPSHRLVHQQAIQVHPSGKGQPNSMPQSLNKDGTHKITVPIQGQLVQNISGKDLQQPRIQQNVVVVRQQGNVGLQQPQVMPKQSMSQSPMQSQIHQQQSTPIILQQRQPGIPQVSSPIIFQHKVLPQAHPTSQGLVQQSTGKVQIPVTQPQEHGTQAIPPKTVSPLDVQTAKLPSSEDHLSPKVESVSKTVIESKEVEYSEAVEAASSKKENEPDHINTANLVEPKKDIAKTDIKPVSTQQQELENVSVIKSQTAATPVQPAQSAVLSEENVSKFSVPIDAQLEHDSKEEWSAKELNIDSVIKKVDALCSSDEVTHGTRKVDKSQLTAKENTQKDPIKSSTDLNELNLDKADDIPSIISSEQEKKEELTDIGSILEPERNDDTHDEEEIDDSVDSNKPMRGGKRGGRQQRGSKKSSAASLAGAIPTQGSPASIEGVQTRRGKTAQGGRGRKGRGGNSRSPASSSTAATSAEKKTRNQSSDQDVYEFHEDSGEENLTAKSERPRLILTIKSPGPAGPQVVQPKSVSSPAPPLQPSQATNTVAAVPVSAPTIAQSQPPTTQSALEATTPPQKEQKDREEFTTPATNTRKSRRLLEKDGGTPVVRNTVDDTIEDVVRNISSPKVPAGSQTPPRRSTRNSVQTTSSRPVTTPQQVSLEKPMNSADIRKSPRANRRSKDRKISETSVDSSDERTAQFDEKSMVKQQVTGNRNASQTQQQQENSNDGETKAISEKKSDQHGNSDDKETQQQILSQSAPSVMSKASETSGHKHQDSTETLALIDPVTGLLTVFQQSKEGKYVPVPGTASVPNAKLVGKQVTQVVISREDGTVDESSDRKVSEVKQAIHAEPHKVANAIMKGSQPQLPSAPPTSSTAGNVTQVAARSQQAVPITIQQQQMQRVQVHVQSHVQTSQPNDGVNVAHGHGHGHQAAHYSLQKVTEQAQIHPPQVQAQQQPSVMPSQMTVQQQPSHQSQQTMQHQSQPQSPSIRTHPLKAHMLNSQHNTSLNKAMISQNIVKVTSGVVSQATTVVTSSNLTKVQSSMAQSGMVSRHVPQGVSQQTQQAINLGQMPQQPTNQSIHNLYVNIPPSSSAVQVAVAHSPRIQQTVMSKTDHVPPPSQQPVQLLHVVTKPMGSNQQQQIIAQHQPVVIHSNKMTPNPTQYATVLQGGKIIQQGGPIQSTVGGKPQTIQVSMPHMSQPQQQHQQQGTSQSQQQQAQQQAQQHAQKQSPTISVVTHQLGKPVQIPGQPQQQSHHAQHSNTPPHIVQSVQQVPVQHHGVPQASGVGSVGKPTGVPQNTIHMVHGQQPGIILGSQNIVTHAAHQPSLGHPPPTGTTILQAKPAHQPQMTASNKSVMGLHQSSQLMTGAVPSPPPKQPHMSGQQPAVTGANSLRATVPPISPQGQARGHLLQPGMPAPAFEASMGEGTFAGGAIRGMPRDHYIMYQQYYRAQPEARIPYIPRSPLVQGSGAEQKDMSEVDDAMVASPPLELRRPGSGSRTIAVPHGLQSPQDRATDSPQVAQVYVHTRIPHPQYQEVSGRYFEPVRQVTAEPPPAHRPAHSVVTPSPSRYTTEPQSSAPPANLAHVHPKMIWRERDREREQREREHREQREQRENEARYYVDEKRVQRKRESERTSIPPGHTGMPSHESLAPAMPTPTGRTIQVSTPPHASQVPPKGDSLLTLLQRYPVMWQGLLALKTDQAAVQMHFVFGNPLVARGSLPCNSDGSTPPLRIAQRMRLEQTQLDGVAKKMQYENEHCMLLALPCGRNHMDVLQQSRNLQTGFITYLQQKMAAGIVNIPVPGSDQAAYVVHIFPSCDFANENLERAAPDLKHRVAEIAHLLIIIATA